MRWRVADWVGPGHAMKVASLDDSRLVITKKAKSRFSLASRAKGSAVSVRQLDNSQTSQLSATMTKVSCEERIQAKGLVVSGST